MFKHPKHFALLLILLIATGCAPSSVLTRDGKTFQTDAEDRILLMPPDIELYEMTMSGMLEPKADWTALAITNVANAVERQLKVHQDTMVDYKEPPESSTKFHDQQQIIKLHEVVGASIIKHQYPTVFQLPTKKNRFEWSLGQRTNVLKEEYGAQYGLFIYVRDSYASAERVAMFVGMAALGVAVPLGQQKGFASLVDLQTGDIVWFNRMFSTSGDLRELGLAQDSVQKLLADFPL